MKTIPFLSAITFSALAFTSCSNDDSQPVNEEEVITTVTVTLTTVGGGSAVVLTSRDLDGDGPNAPVISSIGTLLPTTIYNGTILLENELEDPTENITEEVFEEGVEHQFFYSTSAGLNGTFAYTDEDANGNPIGIDFTFTTAANIQSGNLTVILRHEPNKSGTDVANGNIANAGGETDVQVVFPVTAN